MRDYFLNNLVNDYDIEVHNCSVQKFEHLMQKLGAKGVGKSFFVYKYKGIDISLPRHESKEGTGHKGFKVWLATDLKSAAKRRDFTINALMYDLQNECVVDLFDGLADLKNKKIRIVNTQSFKEDSLRILRAMQFSARFKFKIEPASLKIMQAMSIDNLSRERIFKEFEKMFKAKYLHYGLYYMLQLNIAQKIFHKQLDFKKFYRYSKILNTPFSERFYKYMFIYHLKKEFDFTKLSVLPKEYNICFTHPLLPKKITKRYVLGVATKVEIKNFLGNYNKKVIQYAKELSVFNKKFQAVAVEKIIAQGYKNKAIAQKLIQENIKAIRNVKE